MQKLALALQDSESIQLVTHVHPDGDAIGSTIALALGLKELGKDVSVVLPQGVPRAFQFLTPETLGLHISDSISDFRHRNECLVILDAPDSARTGNKPAVVTFAKSHRLYAIDHHRKGDLLGLATEMAHNTEASSACELVFELLNELQVKMTSQMATCILTGIYTDTGAFQYANTTPTTLEVVAELMRRGAKLNKIVDALTQEKSMASLRLLGVALDRMYTVHDGLVLISAITHADLAAEDAVAEDLTGVNGELTTVAGPAITLFVRETTPGEVSGSLRCTDTATRRKINVRRIAKLLGGNGHPTAAGFTLQGELYKKGSRWQVR